jgi:lactate dehydrogenase-like 2-hydroxyacid dehydrogenase
MKIWKNTKTIDELISDLSITSNKKEAEIALIGSKGIELKEFPKLKGIFKCGVGVDNIPFKEANKRNIKIGLPSKATNEYIFEETACFACHLCLSMLYSDIGSVSRWQKLSRNHIKNKIVLVIGMGQIGKRVAKKLKSFVQVKTFDIKYASLEALKKLILVADCITLHIPLNDSTLNYFDSKMLSLMKDNSSIVNTSRGAIVNETALYKEIKEGRIRSAFDVFWKEPYEGKLKQFYPEKFSMTPHIASTCNEFLIGCAKDFRLFLKEARR